MSFIHISVVCQNKREERFDACEIKRNGEYEIKESDMHEAGSFDELRDTVLIYLLSAEKRI